ncbi:MAG: hypothetical protein LLG01_08725 [Planctomycetaceae bacterium]|nr:hypothetical protein [Planctomycetaceae bacterium]
MDEPIPKVAAADVERIIRRDFPPEVYETVTGILGEYGAEEGHSEIHRVRLAVLKLSAGSLEKLREATEAARQDYRDVLAGAEYPLYSIEYGFGEQDERCQEIIESDWRQYQEWLKRP